MFHRAYRSYLSITVFFICLGQITQAQPPPALPQNDALTHRCLPCPALPFPAASSTERVLPSSHT